MSAGDDDFSAATEVMAPAKLNLALLVGPRRPDGFHEIASLMVPVTLADRVLVERTPGAGLDVACDVAPVKRWERLTGISVTSLANALASAVQAATFGSSSGSGANSSACAALTFST